MTGRSTITIHLPRILAQMVGVEDIAVAGETVGAALVRASDDYPGLGLHIFDEAGALRHHLRIVHNDLYVRERDMMDRPARAGDRIAIIHAVSGG